MNKLRFIYLSLFLSLIIWCSESKAQDTIPYASNIVVKQRFTSWGSCKSDPDYQFADFYFKYASDDIVYRRINNTQLNKTYAIDGVYTNKSRDKGLDSLLSTQYGKLTDINVHTYANDIKNDVNLYYSFDVNEMIPGENSEARSASDPCNNFISNKREGYTMISYVYIDDPIFFDIVGPTSLQVENDNLVLKIDNFETFADNPNPSLEVALDNTEKWFPVEAIIKPNSTIYVLYETIAGIKGADGSNYFNWIGESLKFRIVKTLLDDKITHGNIKGATFYPQGLQFNIEEVTRSYCYPDPNLYIILDSDFDIPYLFPDDTKFKFQIFRGTTSNPQAAVNCTYEKDEGLRYKVIPESVLGSLGLYNSTGTESVTWTLQMFGLDNLSSYACNKTFLIPPKPDPVITKQKAATFSINGGMYHVPDTINPYLMLEVVDDYTFAHLRMPYRIYDSSKTIIPSDPLATITDLPNNSYEEMSQHEKDSINNLFFIDSTALTLNLEGAYLNYFYSRYNKWIDTLDPTSPEYRITDPLGTYEYYADKYHIHEHSHTCSHSHLHLHSCNGVNGLGIPIDCSEDHITYHSPHNLCPANHSHEWGLGSQYVLEHTHSHTHTQSHTLAHTHPEHNSAGHTADPQYDYGVIKRVTLSNNTTSIVGSTYNRVTTAYFERDGLNANYIIRSNGTNYTISAWTEAYILNNVYPNNGIASDWYNDFMAIYRKKWLNQQLGVKVSDGIIVNDYQKLVLIDDDGCRYAIPSNDTLLGTYVKAPPIASFDTSNVIKPSSFCASDGSARITFNGGGAPPYKYFNESLKTLSNFGDFIDIVGLVYEDNPIEFTDYFGNESATHNIYISGGQSISSIDTVPQTCATPNNGAIIVNTGYLSGTIDYKLINESTRAEYYFSGNKYSRMFPGLEAGSYRVEVQRGTCPTAIRKHIKISKRIFSRYNTRTFDATTIDGNGAVSMLFNKRINDVVWSEHKPTSFGSSTSLDSIYYPGVIPSDYDFEASHKVDTQTCIVPVEFTINQPSFEANIRINETSTRSTITTGMNSLKLINSYQFNIFNSGGTKVDPAAITIPDIYTVRLEYDGNSLDLCSYEYPSSPITCEVSINTPILCKGGDAIVTYTPEGGIGGNNFSLRSNNGYTSILRDTLKARAYEYYIKDDSIRDVYFNGSKLTIKHSLIHSFRDTITEPEPVNAQIINPIDVTCKGKNNGEVSIANLSGGSGDYSYRVDIGITWFDTLSTAGSLAPGEHTIYLKDNIYPCPEVTLSKFYISEPDTLKIDTAIIIQPTCERKNGEIIVEVEGGNGFYEFDWKYNTVDFYSTDSLLEDTITYLADTLQYGSYNIMITDNKACNLSYTIELDEYTNPKIDSIRFTDVRCYAELNGDAQVLGVSGTTELNRLVINSLDSTYYDTINDIADSFNGLSKGRYELWAIDDSACISNRPYPLVIDQPDTLLYAVIDTILPVLHKGSAGGQIHSTVYGGNDGLKTITLLNAAITSVDQGTQTNGFPVYFDKLYAGDYSLQIVDRKGCSYTSPVQTVIEPGTALGFTVTEKKDALCKAQTGSITVEAYGGWGEYEYKKASDKGYFRFNTFENLYAGSYILSVRDKYDAIFSDTIIIYEPKDSLQASIIGTSYPTCGNNGSISVNMNGGIAPYKLFFENTPDTTLIPAPRDYTITGRPAGGYLLHLTDSNGCKFDLETSLSDTQIIRISNFEKTYSSTDSSSDGAIQAIVSGGKDPLSYAWEEQYGVPLAETSATLSNVPSGHYLLTVSEADDGCSATEKVYLPSVTDRALEVLELQNETSYLAQNGFAHLKTMLDTLLEVTIINPSGTRAVHSITDSTSQFYFKDNILYLNNLSGGNYFASVNNKQGETAYAEFEIEQYGQFYFDEVQISHAKQMNEASGSISVVVAGGAGNNSFSWEYLDGIVGALSVRDNEYTSTLNNAIAGNYQLTATDQYNNPITQTYIIYQPESNLDITIAEFRNESCKNYEDAYVVLQATGGWGDYQFRQDAVEHYSNDDIWLNLDVREHYFYLTDKMGALDSVAISITEPDYLTSETEFVDSVNCKDSLDGNVFFTINGGTRPYRIDWLERPDKWTEDTVARKLPKGTYNFIFTDSNYCVGQDTLTIYMPEPDSLVFSQIDTTHTTCDTDNGVITVAMQGGTSPYRYNWTDYYSNTVGNENSISGLIQNGYYFLDVLDAHDCPQHFEQLISPSTNPVITDIDTTAVICHDGSTGTAHIVSVNTAEPFAPYSFAWSNSDTGEFADGYKAGIHSVTISDTNNCSTLKYFEVTEPDTLQLVVSDIKDAHCFGYNDGFIELQPLGGVGNYQFNWFNGKTSQRIDSLFMGTYAVTLNDSNDCSVQKEYIISEPQKLIVDLGGDIRICPGNTVNLDGQELSTHQWSNSEGVFSNERFIAINNEDTYALEVTNNIGCFAWDTISISIGNDALQADFLMSSEANLGDTLFIYEVSNIELDSLYWDYNQDVLLNITDSEAPRYMLQLESLETGIQNVGLWAYSGGCISKAVKQVEIIQSNDSTNNYDYIGYKDPLIKKVSVAPNPTDGNFILKVELREMADIQLVLFSIDYGQTIDQRQEYGLDYYELDYQLYSLNTGLYVIMVTANNERKQIKIIIK